MAPRTDRKLAAILAADVVGYSRLVGAGTIARVKTLRKECIEPRSHAQAKSSIGGSML